MSTNFDDLNRHGALLLHGIALQPEDQDLATAFNTRFYPVVLQYVKRRHSTLRTSAIALTGTRSIPALDPQDVEDAANATAWLALEIARASAARFDSRRGTALSWVLRAAAFAYRDVARELARGSRRSVLVTLTASEEIERRLDDLRQEDDPAEIVLGQDMVCRAFGLLSEHERKAITLTQWHGLSYQQCAEAMFGDPKDARRIEYLVRRARNRVAEAWEDLDAAGTVSGLDTGAQSDDKEAR